MGRREKLENVLSLEAKKERTEEKKGKK